MLENGQQSPKVRGTFRAGLGAELGEEGSGHMGLEGRARHGFYFKYNGRLWGWCDLYISHVRLC